MREYEKNRRNIDPLYRLKDNIRRSIRYVLKKGGCQNKSKTLEILGCSFEDFLQHLNNNEYGFVYGDENIDIDHIVPVSEATSEKKLLALNHFTNFQLLPSFYNQHIKVDKPFSKKHFECWYKNEIS